MLDFVNGIEVQRKDSIEDAGYVKGQDPFDVLIARHGEPFLQYRKQWEKASKFELVTDFPTQLDFELNDTCNLKCPMCTWSVESADGKKANYFPFEKFKEIILDGVPRGLRALNMNFINEPLLRKDLPDFISFARENGIVDVQFNTNVTPLSKEMTERLLRSGVTRIQLSIDAFSAETYSKIRQGGGYAKVMENALHFIERKNALGVDSLLTAATFVRMALNESEMVGFVDFWRGKVDYIILREYISPYGSSSVHFGDKAKLNVHDKHFASNFRCNKPWQRMIVRAEGTLLPCCTFFSPSLPMGNVYKENIQDVWSGAKMTALRELHKNGEFEKNPVCHECAVAWVADVSGKG